MSSLKIIAHFDIQEGKLEAFQQVAVECVELVKQNEADALQYDWYYNEAGTHCVVLEEYASSEAVLAHVANVGALLGKLSAISSLALEIYGTPSPQLLAAVAGMDITYYTKGQGL